MNHQAEAQFARSIVKAITEGGHAVTRVGYDGSGGVTFKNAPTLDKIMDHATATDTGTVEFEKNGQSNFVWFIWGNEEDVVGDFSTSLEDIIQPMINRLHF